MRSRCGACLLVTGPKSSQAKRRCVRSLRGRKRDYIALIYDVRRVRLTAEAVLGSGSAWQRLEHLAGDMLSGVAQNPEYMLVILQASAR
jgi:hypothetical protein